MRIFCQPHRGVVLRLDNRENARIVEMCYRTHTTLVNPIIDWTDAEVWEFIKEYKVPYCCLYDEGFKRLGCIGCPMGSVKQRQYEFERYPKYKNLYMLAFQKMIDNHSGGVASNRPRPKQNTTMVDTVVIQPTGSTGSSTRKYHDKEFSELTAEEWLDWWIN